MPKQAPSTIAEPHRFLHQDTVHHFTQSPFRAMAYRQHVLFGRRTRGRTEPYPVGSNTDF